MADKFKAIVINQEGESFSREIKEVDKNFLGEGDVLVKVDYSDLNYKDALILKNGGKLVKEFPRIPGIDFSGKVVESNTDNFKKDDEVIITGCRVGEISHGGYSQYAKVKKDFLVKAPKGISEILSSDNSVLDRFIEKKLKEAGHSLIEQNKLNLNLNPNKNTIIQKNQGALVLK